MHKRPDNMGKNINTFVMVLLVVAYLLPESHADESVLINPFTAAVNPCGEIRNAEFVCLDCATLAFCVQEGGSWSTYALGVCDTDKQFYCDEDLKGCKLQKECQLASKGMRFHCQNPGIFPDPYDCKYYHECNDYNEDTRHVCASGTRYSAATKECVALQSSAECKKQQYDCEKLGDMGSWPGDANIYYICNVMRVEDGSVLYPLLYRCSAGKIFDGDNCVSSGSSLLPDPQSILDNDYIVGASCSSAYLQANPSNCRAYYACSNGKLVSNECPAGTFFNNESSRCALGSCSQQI